MQPYFTGGFIDNGWELNCFSLKYLPFQTKNHFSTEFFLNCKTILVDKISVEWPLKSQILLLPTCFKLPPKFTNTVCVIVET